MDNGQRDRFDVFLSFAPGEDGDLPPVDFVWDALVQLAGRELDIRSSHPLPDGRGSVDLAVGQASPADAEVFVAVLSPSYLAARQGQMEAARFARACNARSVSASSRLFAVVDTPVNRAQVPVHLIDDNIFEMFGMDHVASEAAVNAAVFGMAIKACDALDAVEGASEVEPVVELDVREVDEEVIVERNDQPNILIANGRAGSERAYVYVYYEAADSVQARMIAKQLKKKNCYSLFPYWESPSSRERDEREQEVLSECQGVVVIAGEVDFLPWIEGLRHALIRAKLDEKLPLMACMFPPMDDDRQTWNQTEKMFIRGSVTSKNLEELAKWADQVLGSTRPD